MAIKVKHDGNATSRIYASAAGGKGRRQADDAIRLAQLQASASGRSGGTGGGAHASATAPTTHAQTGSAALGSPGSAPAPQLSEFARMRLEDQQQEHAMERLEEQGLQRLDQIEAQGDLTERLHEQDWARRAEIAQNDIAARRKADLGKQIFDAIMSGDFQKPEELAALREQYADASDYIDAATFFLQRKPTPEQTFRQNTFTDANGVVFDRSGKMLYNPMEIETRRAEAEAKRLDAEKARADKFEMELRKPYKTTTMVDGSPVETLTTRSEGKIREMMQNHFPKLYPTVVDPNEKDKPVVTDTAKTTVSANGTVTTTDSETVEVPTVAKTVEDAKIKWGVGVRK